MGYRCYLPVLAGLAPGACMEPDHQVQVSHAGGAASKVEMQWPAALRNGGLIALFTLGRRGAALSNFLRYGSYAPLERRS
jgi:hypothetical protein